MADQLKIEQVITFIQENPPEAFRLLQIISSKVPSGYSHGRLTIPAGTVDMLVASNANIFMFSSDNGVSLKIGGTTSNVLSNLSSFSYDGAKTSFYVSNESTEDVVISYVTAEI